MQIDFVRSGGFAGMRIARSFDTQKLLPEQASALDKLVEGADFFNLPEQIIPGLPRPDQFQYQITITTGEQKHTVNVSETVIPEPLHPLIEYLTTQTITNKKK
jgi:hypothetical protein